MTTHSAYHHVYWIGGSPCSGKSSIVQLLAAEYGFQTYSCDDAYQRHLSQARPEQHPAMSQLAQMTWDQIWMRPVAQQVADEISFYREEFAMILDDLTSLPASPPILAEGSTLLPDEVAPHLNSPQQAIWIIPSEEFQRRVYPQRGEWVQEILSQCSQAQQAFQNWMDRDVTFARWVQQSAAQLNLNTLLVDGGRSIPRNAQLVAQLLQLDKNR